MRLYLASGNPHKAREFQALADAAPGGRIRIASALEIGGMPAVVEDAGTFLGNARKKVLALAPRLPPDAWALADDSGLCVEALGGAPGVDSAYYAGPQGDPAANLDKLVRTMEAVEEGRRGAEFVCVLALSGPGGVEAHFEARCAGRLTRTPSGEGGFGYDPLFIPDGYDRTTAEMFPQLKNSLSHRGKAWALCAAWLHSKYR